jgi:hypothetical protein
MQWVAVDTVRFLLKHYPAGAAEVLKLMVPIDIARTSYAQARY